MDETCAQCGNPIWLCRSDSNVIHAKVKVGVCRGAVALERHKDSLKKAKDRAKAEERREWGKFYYVDFDLLPPEKEAGTKMPKRSDFYLSQKNAV